MLSLGRLLALMLLVMSKEVLCRVWLGYLTEIMHRGLRGPVGRSMYIQPSSKVAGYLEVFRVFIRFCAHSACVTLLIDLASSDGRAKLHVLEK